MERKRELNYMNAIACLFVILIHVLSLGISSAERTSWQAAVIYFPWRLSAFVVPMFLYTGAVKMARQFMDREVTMKEYGQYFLHRIQKIYIPYVLWTVLYYLSFMKIDFVHGNLKEFLSYLLIGNLASPFYYIIIIMQFYFLMPLWIWMIKHLSAYLAIGISLLITVCMQQSSYILSLFGLTFAYTDRIFPTYIIFWTVGLYVGKYYESIVPTFTGKLGQIIGGVVIVLCAGLAYVQYTGRALGLYMADVKMVADLLSIMFVHSVSLQLTHAPNGVQNVLQKLYESSFFVYLSHCLFLTLGTYYLQLFGVGKLTVLLAARFIICYTVPFVLYGIYSRICTGLNIRQRLLG